MFRPSISWSAPRTMRPSHKKLNACAHEPAQLTTRPSLSMAKCRPCSTLFVQFRKLNTPDITHPRQNSSPSLPQMLSHPIPSLFYHSANLILMNAFNLYSHHVMNSLYKFNTKVEWQWEPLGTRERNCAQIKNPLESTSNKPTGLSPNAVDNQCHPSWLEPLLCMSEKMIFQEKRLVKEIYYFLSNFKIVKISSSALLLL